MRTATHWGCGSRTEFSGCDNNRTISTESYERRVLAGLRERVLDPDLVEVFVAEYREEHTKRAVQMRRERCSAERRLASATATIDRVVAAIGCVRTLIDRIVLTPNPDARGVYIQVEGRLAGIVPLATGREPPETLTVKMERVKGIEPSS